MSCIRLLVRIILSLPTRRKSECVPKYPKRWHSDHTGISLWKASLNAKVHEDIRWTAITLGVCKYYLPSFSSLIETYEEIILNSWYFTHFNKVSISRALLSHNPPEAELSETKRIQRKKYPSWLFVVLLSFRSLLIFSNFGKFSRFELSNR